MPYRINGTEITLQPESGGWIDRASLGLDGNGHPIYPPTRQFELRWSFMSASEFNQLLGFYDLVGSTGTVVATLPRWHTGSYSFFDYTGCVLQEPSVGAYYEEYLTEVRLVVSSVRT